MFFDECFFLMIIVCLKPQAAGLKLRSPLHTAHRSTPLFFLCGRFGSFGFYFYVFARLGTDGGRSGGGLLERLRCEGFAGACEILPCGEPELILIPDFLRSGLCRFLRLQKRYRPFIEAALHDIHIAATALPGDEPCLFGGSLIVGVKYDAELAAIQALLIGWFEECLQWNMNGAGQ
jgi:hypothetical protein